MIEVEKRVVARTGIASLGWYLGHGYVRERLKVKSEVWCVIEEGKIIAECRSQKQAERLKRALAGLDNFDSEEFSNEDLAQLIHLHLVDGRRLTGSVLNIIRTRLLKETK